MATDQHNGQTRFPAQELTALIIDDDKTNRQLFARVIESYGYDVQTVSSGGEAMKLLSDQEVNVILLDVMMPDENGFEVCRRLKDNSATAEVPIIMITALFDPQSQAEARIAGADAFFHKPFDMDELKRTMERLTHQSDVASESSSVQHFPQT